MNIILIPGTWANTGRNAPQDEWWHPTSAFSKALRQKGHSICSFPWDTKLDGIVGPNSEWIKAGINLGLICPRNAIIIAHSHGGQVASYAAANGLKINKLITLATPVRADVPYDLAKKHINTWTHVYGYFDWVQVSGSLMDGKFQLFPRKMKYADKNIKIKVDHSNMHTVETWDKYNLWRELS